MKPRWSWCWWKPKNTFLVEGECWSLCKFRRYSYCSCIVPPTGNELIVINHRNPENRLLLQYRRDSLSQKMWTYLVLLLCGIMRRGASYLYRFSTNNLTGVDFSWGSNLYFIISFIFSFACFSSQGLHCSSRVCMIDYNKFISCRRYK